MPEGLASAGTLADRARKIAVVIPAVIIARAPPVSVQPWAAPPGAGQSRKRAGRFSKKAVIASVRSSDSSMAAFQVAM